MPVKLIFSGNRISIKVTGGIGDLMTSPRKLQPQKGTQNLEHLQTKFPRWLVNKIMKQEEQK
jgi:hypothetical protein